ncbi:MAG: sarcosine oxidase subunit gamma [Pseudomonadota bacterium]
MNELARDLLPAATVITALAPACRFSLRIAPQDGVEAAGPLGFALPERIGARASANSVEALMLGPDEWLILAPEAARERLVSGFEALSAVHSCVDISDREISLSIGGPGVLDLLSVGCPRDLAALPEGEARRTVFDGVSVVLWRDGSESFRLDAWRSFMPHIESLLASAERARAADCNRT